MSSSEPGALEVFSYCKEKDADEWNRMAATARNGSFLFDRGYMDYHADRFVDASLMIRRDGELLALLPADRRGDTLNSHGGLTYGGFVFDHRMTAPLMLEVFDRVAARLRAQGVARWLYKPSPTIYHRAPAQEDLYALFRNGARLWRRDVVSVVDMYDPAALPRQERRRRGARKAEKAGVVAGPSDDWAGFWAVLENRLGEKYGRRPVHTLAEIRLLAGRFPDRIRLYAATSPAGEVLAGVVCYDVGPVLHAQYISATEAGRTAGAQDLLFRHLIDEAAQGRRWFSFGVSNEDDGRHLNVGLVEYKESFGARSVAQDFYELVL